MMKTFSILGCGKLAAVVTDALLKGLLPEYRLEAVFSRSAEKASALAEKAGKNGFAPKVCSSYEDLISVHTDILVETASPSALKETAIPALEAGTSIVTISIGAFADPVFFENAKKAAAKGGARIYIASGATGGFDVLRTVSIMGDSAASFFNEKGPDALKGTAVYDETLQNERRTVFSGTAREAIGMFPTKVNVTVAASLASVGPENMKVTMVSTPGFTGDTQRVEIRNSQVKATVDVYSATSEIAGWSIVNVLQNIVSPVIFF